MRPYREDRFLIEGRLSGVLMQAKAAYEASKKQFDVARLQVADLGLDHPDGRRALHQATKAHKVAFRKYRQALMDFNYFILYGKIPEGEPDNPSTNK